MPHIHPKDIHHFLVDFGPPITLASFHRTRRPELYDGPRVLLARSIEPDQRIRAAYLSEPASFSERVLAIRAPLGCEEAARAICAF